MSTNYYAVSQFPLPAKLHIGLKACGWAFALHVHPDLGIKGKADWDEILNRPGVQILDSYERPISFTEWSGIVESHGVQLPIHDGARAEGTWGLQDWEFS